MDWKDLGKQVAKVAPVLGTALGGPVGGAAGALVASLFGVEDTPDAVDKALKADPEWAFKVMDLEKKHEQALKQLSLEEKKAELADTQQAREVHAQHWMPSALTFILAVMVSAIIAALVWIAIPESNREVIYLIVGQLIGAFSTAVAYWLGSSRGSAVKDGQIAVLRRQ